MSQQMNDELNGLRYDWKAIRISKYYCFRMCMHNLWYFHAVIVQLSWLLAVLMSVHKTWDLKLATDIMVVFAVVIVAGDRKRQHVQPCQCSIKKAAAIPHSWWRLFVLLRVVVLGAFQPWETVGPTYSRVPIIQQNSMKNLWLRLFFLLWIITT